MTGEIKLAEHPRAVRHIAMAKGYGGLAGFGLIAFLSLQAGTTTPDILLRALMGGVVGYVLAWGTTVIVWRQLAVAEVRAQAQRALQLREQRKAAAQAATESPSLDETMVIR